MVVVGREAVTEFGKRHADCRAELSALIRELEAWDLRTPQDVLARYPSAKVIDGRLVVFKVHGNRYRLTTRFAYNTGVVSIIAAETHADYDRRRLHK